MSPTKKPSAVAGLRRGIGAAPAATAAPAPAPVPETERKPAQPIRVNLSLPPDLYRQLQRWSDDAADTLDRPRVGVQDALRSMIRACITAPGARAAALAELKSEPR